MQIMRFVVFFIQENLYSNILSNSIFYSILSLLFPISNTQSYTGCILKSLCLMHKNII